VSGVRELQREKPSLDAGTVFKRRDVFTSSWNDGEVLIPMVENSGAALVRGRGELVGVKRVAVTGENGQRAEIEARHAVAICTGSDPVVPNIPGLRESNPWGPRQATSSSEVPKHLLVLGAGAVGVEMATAYASLGAQVSLVSRGPELLPRIDPEAGRLVREGLESQGARVHVSATLESVAREDTEGCLTVQLSNGSKISGVTRILAATGRKANTSGMGLENFGIDTNGSPIAVSESLDVPAVPGRWLYALGDVNGRAPMSHSSKYHGRIAANVIIARSHPDAFDDPGSNTPWSKVSATNDILAQPQVVFTRPTVASVGLTRRGAEAAGLAHKVRVVTAPVATLGAKLHQEGYKDGWAQWIIDLESNKLVGATFVGDGVAELLHASTVAIVGGLTVDRLAHAVPPFPTMSEVYLNLLEAAEGL
jgi:dihydrolipoamide dehydrogenase